MHGGDLAVGGFIYPDDDYVLSVSCTSGDVFGFVLLDHSIGNYENSGRNAHRIPPVYHGKR